MAISLQQEDGKQSEVNQKQKNWRIPIPVEQLRQSSKPETLLVTSRKRTFVSAGALEASEGQAPMWTQLLSLKSQAGSAVSWCGGCKNWSSGLTEEEALRITGFQARPLKGCTLVEKTRKDKPETHQS